MVKKMQFRCASCAINKPLFIIGYLLLTGCLGVCAGVQAQLLAVGLSNGEVALYKLWNVKGGEPVRIISLADWGFEPETTGSVAELQWSPDNRAIAVIVYTVPVFPRNMLPRQVHVSHMIKNTEDCSSSPHDCQPSVTRVQRPIRP